MRRIAQGKANDVNPTTLCKAMSAMGKAAAGKAKTRDYYHYAFVLPEARKRAAEVRRNQAEALAWAAAKTT